MSTAAILLGATLLLVALSLGRALRRERTSLAVREAATEAGLVEPVSLHPVVDPQLCIGCASCVDACPEKHVLGMIEGKAELVDPTRCIGHGACRAACPSGAIQLVFGTARRGVDIPHVKPDFETNVPGIFIAGELGGMGLIRNAIEQGRQAVDSIRRLDGLGRAGRFDVVIVGAGPAGFSASLAALEHGLRAVTVEQDSLGGSVAHYPRGKLVMTAPAHLPLVGKIRLGETTKEALLRFWQGVERRTGVAIRYGERMEEARPDGGGFVVRTSRGAYPARALLLAVGRRGTPRQLGVPGEELPKVTYRLIDPEQYRGRRVLVVGGGDSALEAAASLAAEPGTHVVLSYRGESFPRARAQNRERVRQAEVTGTLRLLLRSEVRRVHGDSVVLDLGGRGLEVPNDAVIVCAGGILPTEFLRGLGVGVETKHGTA